MEDRFDDPNFWERDEDGVCRPWFTVVDENGTAHIVAKAKDGRLFTWQKGGFLEYGDPFTNWVREVREAYDKR